MDDRAFRRSKDLEDRTDAPGEATEPTFAERASAKFAKDDWMREAEQKPRDRTKLAKDLGADSVRKQSDDQAGRGDMLPVSASTHLMSATDPRHEAIVRAAGEAGIPAATALAIAERESNFDPAARSSKTIAGMFQMRGDLRRQYGVGDSNDPYDQAKGWASFFRDNKGEMARVLGRDPTDAEGYLGHHFGSTRAARMLKMDPSTPVDQVFTPEERRLNPHFDRAGTVGALNSSVTADIGRRQAKFGGDVPDLSEFGDAAEAISGAPSARSAPDFSSFGKLASLEQPPTEAEPNPAIEERKFSAPEQPTPQPSAPAPSAPDLSNFGVPVA